MMEADFMTIRRKQELCTIMKQYNMKKTSQIYTQFMNLEVAFRHKIENKNFCSYIFGTFLSNLKII